MKTELLENDDLTIIMSLTLTLKGTFQHFCSPVLELFLFQLNPGTRRDSIIIACMRVLGMPPLSPASTNLVPRVFVPYCACWLDETLVKGNEDAGYEGVPAQSGSAHMPSGPLFDYKQTFKNVYFVC